MRVLYLTPRFPWPPLKGDQLIFYQRLRLLGPRHEITVLSFVEDDQEAAGAAHIAPFCERIETVSLPFWRSVLNVATAAPFSSVPLQVLYFRSAEYRRKLRTLLAEGSFDLVHANFHRLGSYLDDTTLPVVLELMDSMTLRMERNAVLERPPKKWLYAEELRRMRGYEPALANRADEVIVVAEQDRAKIPHGNVNVIPNGVDTDAFTPRPDAREPNTIVFHGNMSYEPNVHGATWFVREVLPRIRAREPRVKVLIAGSKPSRAVLALAGEPSVEVTGFVESMPGTLARAAVAVAPLRSGSGIQNKILEAFAMGLPVVTTPTGIGGIAARADEHALVAADAEAFADAVVRLMQEPDLAERLGTAGRALVLARYSWERAADDVDAIYRRVTRGG
jgi:sugar transferase (PEP-CTERM/EpsH1 system associated)